MKKKLFLPNKKRGFPVKKITSMGGPRYLEKEPEIQAILDARRKAARRTMRECRMLYVNSRNS